jgi:hypothetical protein
MNYFAIVVLLGSLTTLTGCYKSPHIETTYRMSPPGNDCFLKEADDWFSDSQQTTKKGNTGVYLWDCTEEKP